jgi:signal transduction histidine kinase
LRLSLKTDAPAVSIGDHRAVRRRHLQRLADIAIPWGVGLLLVLTVVDEQATPTTWPLLIIGVALATVQGAALRWRRRYPEWVMAVALLAGAGTQFIAPEGVFPVAGLFAMWSLAIARPPRVSLVGLVGLVALSASNFFTTTVEDTLFTMVVAVGVWALAEAARNRRAAIQEGAQRAVSEEQARIARELHDVIAHSVSVIVVQASAADDVFDTRPDQARAALRSIERSGRDALRELRRLLAAVRPAAGVDPTGPQPGLDRLEELADPLRAGGLEVVLRREGPATTVPAGVDLSAYRIVQEALTNTLRHARATRAEVTVRYAEDAIEVDVRDDGRGASAEIRDGGGHGLIGMRERASLLGGTLEAGPLPNGGYRVHARLPLEDTP